MKLLVLISSLLLAEQTSGLAFVANKNHRQLVASSPSRQFHDRSTTLTKQHDRQQHTTRSSLTMLDDQVVLGAGVALAGLVAGVGLVAFTEAQGERAKQRGGGLSDRMATNIAGGLLEDMEVSSVDDLGSLTSQLERALMESGGAKAEDLDMTEESRKRLSEEADDGW